MVNIESELRSPQMAMTEYLGLRTRETQSLIIWLHASFDSGFLFIPPRLFLLLLQNYYKIYVHKHIVVTVEVYDNYH